ncbi:MAG: acyltransferase [Burkholderiales bacterium]|nr:acyltransferase [Anaerolineae bacterium]
MMLPMGEYPQERVVLSAINILFILNIAANPNSLIRLENRPFNFLGKISYGLYMFHPLVIIVTLAVLRNTTLAEDNFLLFNLVLYAGSIAGTIALAAVSYRFYESRFLRLKDRFSVVQSGAPVENSAVSF